MGDAARIKSFELAELLRQKDIRVLFDQAGRSLKAQMKYADKMNAKYSMVIGDKELETECAVLKNMESGDSVEINFSNIQDFAEHLK